MFAASVAWVLSCGRGNVASTMATPPTYPAKGAQRCSVKPSQLRPLVVEWSAADRASLEARLRRGVVAVRYEGCEMEVLRGCAAPGSYSYAGITRKREQVAITDADELYAQLPVGAARLEAKLARAGQLRVDMTLVGMLEADTSEHARSDLAGRCEGATHVITGVQVGAFEFYAGAEAAVGAGGQVGVAGAGARSSASHEVLNSDGHGSACEAASTADERAPEGCGALLRVEMAPLSTTARPPTCPEGTAWDGARCTVTKVYCPTGTQAIEGRCVMATAATSAPATTTSAPGPTKIPTEDDAVCVPLCERMISCEAETSGVAAPEGAGLAKLTDRCLRSCRFLATDYTRPQLRRCLAETTCAGVSSCMNP